MGRDGGVGVMTRFADRVPQVLAAACYRLHRCELELLQEDKPGPLAGSDEALSRYSTCITTLECLGVILIR